MFLIGPILIALAVVCLALGISLTSAAWFVASLAATAAAAYWLWRNRDKIGAPAVPSAAGAAESDEHDDSGPFAPMPPVHGVAIAADDVWVNDGRPEFHLAGCARLGPGPERIPRGQAVEDGFVACEVCRPTALASVAAPVADESTQVLPIVVADESTQVLPIVVADEPTGVFPIAVADEPTGVFPIATADDVWVVDGRPNYHRLGCTLLSGAKAEPIARSQAVEDGFVGCLLCDPDELRAADAAPAPAVESEPIVKPAPMVEPAPVHQPAQLVGATESAAAGEVWVVDGRPRYHRGDCMIIKGQHAEPIPHEQATEDGFMPCSLCEPDVVRST